MHRRPMQRDCVCAGNSPYPLLFLSHPPRNPRCADGSGGAVRLHPRLCGYGMCGSPMSPFSVDRPGPSCTISTARRPGPGRVEPLFVVAMTRLADLIRSVEPNWALLPAGGRRDLRGSPSAPASDARPGAATAASRHERWCSLQAYLDRYISDMHATRGNADELAGASDGAWDSVSGVLLYPRRSPPTPHAYRSSTISPATRRSWWPGTTNHGPPHPPWSTGAVAAAGPQRLIGNTVTTASSGRW